MVFCRCSIRLHPRCKRMQSLDPAASWDSLGDLQPADEFLLAIRIIGLSEDSVTEVHAACCMTTRHLFSYGFRLTAELRNGRHRQLTSSRACCLLVLLCLITFKPVDPKPKVEFWAAPERIRSCQCLGVLSSMISPAHHPLQIEMIEI
mgnify:CR=1 FL=1